MIGSSIRLRSWIPRYEIVRRKEPESRLRQWNVRVSRSRIALITHAPAWGRTFHWVLLSGGTWASTHAPAWGANVLWFPWNSGINGYNSRPMWGRTPKFSIDGEIHIRLQLTPPCGGEPWDGGARVKRKKASTHAPVWGRTSKTLGKRLTNTRSNSRPVWGANRIDEDAIQDF